MCRSWTTATNLLERRIHTHNSSVSKEPYHSVGLICRPVLGGIRSMERLKSDTAAETVRADRHWQTVSVRPIYVSTLCLMKSWSNTHCLEFIKNNNILQPSVETSNCPGSTMNFLIQSKNDLLFPHTFLVIHIMFYLEHVETGNFYASIIPFFFTI